MEISEKQIKSIVNRKVAKVFISKYKPETQTLVCTVRGFSGIKTAAKLHIDDYQKIKINAEISRGTAQVLAVDKKRNIFYLSSGNYLGIVPLPSTTSICRIRILGQNTDAKFTITKM